MNNPMCENCGSSTMVSHEDGYECPYCGYITDVNGDVIYETESV